MTELEKVEKLRERADVSFAEAKEALDIAGGDVLDALIYLEKQGKSTVPAGGGFFTGAGTPDYERQYSSDGGYREEHRGETFGDIMRRFGRFCLMVFNKGNTNFLEATKGESLLFSCPVTGVVILLLFFFWAVIPLFILSLFLGLRYRFRGDELGREAVNRVMDNASNVVDDVKKSFNEKKSNSNEDI